jgi:hypothetical protein|tara:strand:- start:161 stop:799 length:639 start_codon:yes stop_codon:yes gene_type:complete
MIFTIQSRDEKFLEKIYDQSMKELDDFFGLNWERNKPRIFLVKDRSTINQLRGMKTADWIVGWVNNQDVFVLDKNTYEKESCHTYSDDEYLRLIKHELAHAFFLIVSGFKSEPDWLWEGVAIYLSDQNKTKKKPNQLKEFLQHYSHENKNSAVYNESGFAVEFLAKNFGKQKLLNLIKSLKEIDSEEKFAKKFEEIYGFDLSYKNFQKPSKK